jgi:tetratricopeptide (TPR) repeat protein/ADP-heptose:LPS heptosyltransferase/glycosyltransferase involved in cell wall biosynthesis
MDDVRLYPMDETMAHEESLTTKDCAQLINDAKAYFTGGLFEQAISSCASCLELQPGHAEALRLSAKGHIALKNMSAAIADLTTLCRILPEDATAHLERANMLLRSGDPALATAAFRAALALQPNSHDSKLGLARALIRTGEFTEGEAILNALLEAKPGHEAVELELLRLYKTMARPKMAEALGFAILKRTGGRAAPAIHREIAKDFGSRGEWDTAVQHFKVYTAAKPGDATGRHDLGRALVFAGQHESAETELREALKLAPARHSVLLDLARALAGLGRLDEAGDAFLTFTQETRDIRGYLEFARLLARNERYRAAIRHLRKALEQYPAEFRLHRELATIYNQIGQKSAATAAYRKAIAIVPDDIGLLYDFARFQLSAKRHKAALKMLRQAFEAEPHRPGLRAKLVECMLATGQTQEAESLLRETLRQEPLNLAAHLDLIALLSTAGQSKSTDEAFEVARQAFGEDEQLLTAVAKAKLRLRSWQDAAIYLDRLRELQPGALFPLLQSVRVAMTMRKYDRAKKLCTELLDRFPDEIDALYEWGRVCMETSAPDRAQESFTAIIARRPDHHQSFYRLSQLAMRGFDLEAAASLLSKAIALAPHSNLTYRLDRGRMWLSLNQLEHAEEDARSVLKTDPNNAKAAQILGAVAEAKEEAAELKIVAVIYGPPDAVENLGAELVVPGDTLDWHFLSDRRAQRRQSQPLDQSAIETAFANSPEAGWITIGNANHGRLLRDGLHNDKQVNALRFVEGMYGYALLEGATGEPPVSLYRRDLLQLFIQVAALRGVPFPDLFAEHHSLLRGILISRSGVLERLAPPRPPAETGPVFLVSRHGIELYGGGEHFLRTMGKLYREKGFSPRIIGMRSDMSELVMGEQDGFAFADLPVNPASILDLTLREQPTIVHILSGLGYEILGALKYLHVATIYGTHFWRDMFEDIGGYQNLEENAIPRREFNQIIRSATAIYSNSNYTDQIKRLKFGVSTPIIYSLNDEPDHEPPQSGHYALLVNARPEKGFDLVLKVAARVPHIPFLVIASQSPVAQAEEAVAAANLTNVTVIGKTSNLAEIYQQARVVLVPSYAFRETFSRVVIEAHRHGLPVVGSNQGNVPYLLGEPGVALPEEPEAWADELHRLYTVDGYYGLRQKLAVENSQRYAFSGQTGRLGRLISFVQKRILVGVGAGIGNIVQTSPLIRRLAEHFGRPVDVVVNQDFPDCALLLAGDPHVNMVFTVDKNVVRREYDLVYICHSFGDFIPSFNTNKTIVARNHYDFQVTRDVHESVFNLRCAHDLLGMSYDDGDAAEYFVGRYKRPVVGRRYVGIHSGGKGGEWEEGSWLSKRWPYYKDLAEALKARGFEVASFGVASEYVPGTVDRTGTPLAETIQNIAACEYFIGNDSGLMHIADALGVPLTTIFGPTSVVKNGPLAPTSSVVELKKPCAPCQFDADRFAQCVCIAEVSLEQVLRNVLAKLKS